MVIKVLEIPIDSEKYPSIINNAGIGYGYIFLIIWSFSFYGIHCVHRLYDCHNHHNVSHRF